jgi:hypothetical protein
MSAWFTIINGNAPVVRRIVLDLAAFVFIRDQRLDGGIAVRESCRLRPQQFAPAKPILDRFMRDVSQDHPVATVEAIERHAPIRPDAMQSETVVL